jgi:membrane protease YdiL (CAAX protease family)
MRSVQRTIHGADAHFLCYNPGVRAELREVAGYYAAAFAGTAGLALAGSYAGSALGGAVGAAISDVSAAGTALLFFGLALSRARASGGARRFGIDLAGLVEPTEEELDKTGGRGRGLGAALVAAAPSALRETAVALAVALVIFPPFVAGFWWWHGPMHAWRWSAPPDLAAFALAQVVMVALPEEAFFRGFVQTRLSDVWPPKGSFLGAPVDPRALVLQAALFALVHLAAEPRLDELATFFPGLLFGWLRARRDGIGASVALHALSNVLADFLVRGWLF